MFKLLNIGGFLVMELDFVYKMYVIPFIWNISATSIKEQESEKEKKQT